MPETLRFLGDHWERSYGDLEWRGVVGDRLMPWYFLASDGRSTWGYGVKTGAAAICYWQADLGGVSLWLDVRSGGSDVLLGERKLEAATVVGSAWAATARCASACASIRGCRRSRSTAATTGTTAYGNNCSAEGTVHDCELLAGLAPSGDNRPFMVIDMGWGAAPEGAGPGGAVRPRHFPTWRGWQGA